MKATAPLLLVALLAAGLAPAQAQTTPDQRSRATSKDVQDAEPAVREVPPAKPPVAAPRPAAATAAKGPAAAKGPKASDRLDLDTTQITGNRELPKVMVVVPWKRSDIGDLVGRPVNSLVDEALQPVDREVFRREIDYYGALMPDRPRNETHVTGGTVNERPEK
jgi:hypothetical protein